MDLNTPGKGRRVSSDREPQLPSYMQQKPAQRSAASARSGAPARSVDATRVTSHTNRTPVSTGRTPTTGAKRAPSGAARASAGSHSASGSQQASRSSSSGGAKRKQKTTRSQRFMRFALVMFGVMLLAVAAILIIKSNSSGENASMIDLLNSGDKFREGISIQGVDISGKTAEEAKPLVDQAASKLLNSVSVTLKHGDNSWALGVVDMKLTADVEAALVEAMAYGTSGTLSENADARDLLEENGKDFPLLLTIDMQALNAKLAQIATETDTPPVEPYMIPTLDENINAQFAFQAGTDGQNMDIAATSALVEKSIQQGDHNAVLTPVFASIPPTQDAAFVQDNTKRISTFTTTFPRSSSEELVMNRCFNIEKAAGIINCQVLPAGEIWSFNTVVGPRTKATGWKEANGISGGKEFTRQYGGGICQVSTTLYGALLRGNIKIPENGRTKHSIPSTYVEKGQDATVDTSGIDLLFENDTGAPLYVFVYITKNKDSSRRLDITVSLYGKPLPTGITYVPRSELLEPEDRVNPKYVDDPAIPVGYELTVIEMRPRYTAEVYLDKLENGKLLESKQLYTDSYRGNEAEIHRGTGNHSLFTVVPENAVLMPGFPALVLPGAQPTEIPTEETEEEGNTTT